MPRARKKAAEDAKTPRVAHEAKGESASKPSDADSGAVDKKKAPRRRAPLDLAISDNPCPDSRAVVACLLSHDESRLFVARSGGSIAAFRVIQAEGSRIFNVIPGLVTGGTSSRSITAMALCGPLDTQLVVAYGCGSIALIDAATLQPTQLLSRSGGIVRSFTRCGPSEVFGACADGSARRFAVSASGIEVIQTLAKSIDCERALCVAASSEQKLVFVGDDSRTVAAWELTSRDSRHAARRWDVKLPRAFPLCIATSGTTVAVGTSLNEVVFIDALSGLLVNTFEHHRGPVTVLTASAGTFYAAGWHDSIRAYRAAVPSKGRQLVATAGDYAPAEVKRRTHYHEVTDMCVGANSGLVVSTARDGTLQFANLDRFFTHPASYIDAGSNASRWKLMATDLLVTFRGTNVELYRVLPHSLLPLSSVELEGSDNISGVWPSPCGGLLCCATDSRVAVFRVDCDRDRGLVKAQKVASAPVAFAVGACFPTPDVCVIATGRALLTIKISEEAVATAFEAKKTISRGRASREDRLSAAARAPGVAQIYTHAKIAGPITSVCTTTAAATTGDEQSGVSYVFATTQSPAGVHWLQVDRAGHIATLALSEPMDAVLARPLAAARQVTFLCPSDGRHYLASQPGSTSKKKLVPITLADHLLPQNAALLGRASKAADAGADQNPPFVGTFPNGVVDVRSSAKSWYYSRPDDRKKAKANDVKARVDFAAFEPASSSPAWASSADAVRQELEALRRVRKTHRRERATLAVEGDAADGEGHDSDEEAVLEAHAQARDAAAGSAGVDSVLVLRRNLPGILESLDPMWRVRRFGN